MISQDTGPCFYCPDLPAAGQAGRLPEAESRHAGAARRIRAGDSIGLIDGSGTLASAVVEAVDRRSLSFTVRELWQRPPAGLSVVVASAVPKGERFRGMIDMLSQLGVAGIVPLHCERSTARPGASAVARWRRIAIEACKQSRNPFVPEIAEPANVGDSLARVPRSDTLAYADAGGGTLDDIRDLSGALRLYIGPEGGFSELEKSLLESHEARPVGFGDNILRVETAAVAGAVLALLGGRTSGTDDGRAPE